ncbi:MAG TPA: MFS transporter, partial [Thermoleophilia bacterium]|nr:MFS transporter [Thermoleophilia bacterium]
MFAVDRRTKLLTLGAMCFALFMAMLDNTVVNVALPNIQRHLGSGVSGLQWIIDAYTLVFASLMLSGGTLGDIFGRKRFFLICISLFTLSSVFCGTAPSLALLILFRVIQGAGGGGLQPMAQAILADVFPPQKRGLA